MPRKLGSQQQGWIGLCQKTKATLVFEQIVVDGLPVPPGMAWSNNAGMTGEAKKPLSLREVPICNVMACFLQEWTVPRLSSPAQYFWLLQAVSLLPVLVERNEVFAWNGGTEDGLSSSEQSEAGRARSRKRSYCCFLCVFYRLWFTSWAHQCS